ncbi:hypothetical protein [uncultured Kordia sp.]|uniref:hypothetical protein n=1 Tax=uncultured Kordia sp. TaxID=507699 RepID=UPI0026328463|nr:hypothetical protein [uncultured Kordia sp.]
MKHTVLIPILLFFSYNCFAQLEEGEGFCETKKNESYFPIDISVKKFFWGISYYTEKKIGKKKFNGKTYIEFKQTWKGGNSDVLYLRTEKGVVYAYREEFNKEQVRYDSSFKVGHSWKTLDGNTTYTIMSYQGKLTTPFCEYEDLLVMKADLKDEAFLFYYLRGKGYIGATTLDKELISCMTPKFEFESGKE